MRPGQNNFKNRNRNRNRRHGGGGGGGGGGGNPGNRVLDSNGPDVKLRGTAQTIAEKYMQLARDAASSGDRVMAESYYQHADHYYRLWLAAQPAGQPIQFSRRLDEDVEDLDGADAEDEAGDAAEGADVAEAVPAAGDAGAPEGDAAASGEEGQRNTRPREGREQGNRDQQQGGGRDRFRNRWPRRGDRNGQEPREANGQTAEGSADEGERNERPERAERQERPRRERSEAAAGGEDAGKDWEAPSFLKRPVPAVNGSEGGEADAGAAERRPRGRRPRYGEEGVTPNEPVAGED
jgi:hypothetical protein